MTESRQVRRHNEHLDKKAKRKGTHGRGGYSSHYLDSVRYVPCKARGKKYPFASKRQAGRANLEALNHAKEYDNEV